MLGRERERESEEEGEKILVCFNVSESIEEKVLNNRDKMH